MILMGALASSSDTLMRLIYQKYKSSERDMADKGLIVIEQDDRVDHAKVKAFRCFV